MFGLKNGWCVHQDLRYYSFDFSRLPLLSMEMVTKYPCVSRISHNITDKVQHLKMIFGEVQHKTLPLKIEAQGP